MRKLLLTLTCFTSLYAEQMYLYELSPVIALSENGTSIGAERSMMYGMQFQYNNLDFPIKPEISYFVAPTIKLYEDETKVTGQLLLLSGVYDLEYTALLTPFVKAGLGYQYINKNAPIGANTFVLGTGAGLKLHVVDKVSMKLEASMSLQNLQKSNILVFAGVDIAFGNEDNTPVTVSTTAEPAENNVSVVPVEVNSTEPAHQEQIVEVPVYISKADHNLTEAPQSKQEVLVRDEHNQVKSLTLFVPYLFRSYALDDASKDVLKQYAIELQKEKSKITIIGHTDTKGRRAFNKELSLKRANKVKALFIEYGVAEDRITVEGRGESEPIADGNDPAANYLNKRIEIKVTH